MRIWVEKITSGMYASIPKRYYLDTSQLGSNEQSELEALISESDFFNLSNSLPTSNAADYNTFKITIETGSKRHSVTRSNFSMDKSLALLVKAVTKYIKESSGK